MVHAQIKSAQETIEKFQNVFTNPPERIPSKIAVDAPLLGNGSLAVALAGEPEKQIYYLTRNDFWRLKSGFDESFPGALCKIQISIPSIEGASYNVKQDLYNAITKATFIKGDTSVEIQTVVMATEDLLMISIKNTGKKNISGNALIEPPNRSSVDGTDPSDQEIPDETSTGKNRYGVQWFQRGFVKDVNVKTAAAVAMKMIGKSADAFMLKPGETTILVCASSSNLKKADYLNAVQHEVQKLTTETVGKFQKKHLNWWHQFWNQCWVDFEDSVIEHQYYRSQYNMASCSRDPKFPPGIFGSWVTQEIPAWNGDYHLNYNYSAPYYASYSSNHLEQALPYESPLMDFMSRGQYYSKNVTQIPNGILYPVGIGPLGIETTRKNELIKKNSYIKEGDVEDEGLFYGQKTNASYGATCLSMAFYKTYDSALARRIYPYIKSVAIFWQHYLKMEDGRYVIENDAIHEGTIGTKNAILSLGLARMVLQTAIDMSEFLGMDQSLRKDWTYKHDHIVGYPTQSRDGKIVFRYSEKGTAWWPDNTLGIQHIYPAGQIGLSSDSIDLQIARNTIEVMQRWNDLNGSNSFFPAAVRVGYSPDTIFSKLHDYSLHAYPNGFQVNNPHGIENCSTVPNTINEMMCMSNQHVLRIFEVWPRDKDAFFVNIRSDGAFLISSSVKNNVIQYVKIVSEKGRQCVLQNPWPGRTLMIKSDLKGLLMMKGDTVVLLTKPKEKLTITAGN